MQLKLTIKQISLGTHLIVLNAKNYTRSIHKALEYLCELIESYEKATIEDKERESQHLLFQLPLSKKYLNEELKKLNEEIFHFEQFMDKWR